MTKRAPTSNLVMWRVVPAGDPPADPVAAPGGRWHRGRRPLMYLSLTPALAMLESLAHVDAPLADHLLVEFALREPRPAPSLRQLPADWKTRKTVTRDIGERWLAGHSSNVMFVPSALCMHSTNALVATARISPGQLHIRSTACFRFDRRLLHSVSGR